MIFLSRQELCAQYTKHGAERCIAVILFSNPRFNLNCAERAAAAAAAERRKLSTSPSKRNSHILSVVQDTKMQKTKKTLAELFLSLNLCMCGLLSVGFGIDFEKGRTGAAFTKCFYNSSPIFLLFFYDYSPRAFSGFFALNPSQPQ
jgi:hypothetical protein